eukprot:6474692-Karenia_brevis.AAC.1
MSDSLANLNAKIQTLESQLNNSLDAIADARNKIEIFERKSRSSQTTANSHASPAVHERFAKVEAMTACVAKGSHLMTIASMSKFKR